MTVPFPLAACVPNRKGILQHASQNGWPKRGMRPTTQIFHVHSRLCAGNEAQMSDPLRRRNKPREAAARRETLDRDGGKKNGTHWIPPSSQADYRWMISSAAPLQALPPLGAQGMHSLLFSLSLSETQVC